MYTLRQQQSLFAQRVGLLIARAYALGYEITLGDAYRDPRCPYGSRRSKHHERLAIDLNLFRDGKYLTETQDHAELGEWWESIGGVWGGRFSDGNHYQAADAGAWLD
jgi:hypothetical protein